MQIIEVEIPEDIEDIVKEYRCKLFEGVAEESDELFEQFIEDPDSLREKDILSAIRKATIEMRITPVLCGSSLKNKGVQMLLNAIVDFLPCPLDIPPIKGLNPYTKKKK